MGEMISYKVSGCYKTKEKEFVPEGVEVLDSFAFGSEYANSSPLRWVSLPGTLKKIGKFAFANCKRLESVIIPHGVEEIDSNVFKGCEALKEIYFPSTLKKLGMFCFEGCTGLEKIVVEDITAWANVRTSDCDGWKYARKKPVLWCKNLPLERLEVPLELAMGGAGRGNPIAFCSFSNIREVVYPVGAMSAGLDFCGCENLQKVWYPRELEYLNLDAFCGCPNLQEIKFPSVVSQMCTSAFLHVAGPSKILDFIPEEDGIKYVGGWCVGGSCEVARIREGTVGIASGAFMRSEKLREVLVPKTVRTIGFQALSWVLNLSYIKFEGGTPDIKPEAFIPARRDGVLVSECVRVIVHDDRIMRMRGAGNYINRSPYHIESEDDSGVCSPVDNIYMMREDVSPQMILQDPMVVRRHDIRSWFNGILTGGHPRVQAILKDHGYNEEEFISRIASLAKAEGRGVLEGITRLDKIAADNERARQLLTELVLQLMG